MAAAVGTIGAQGPGAKSPVRAEIALLRYAEGRRWIAGAPVPRPPAVAPAVAALRGGVFSRLAHRIAQLDGEVYPLHVGDTWLEPLAGGRMQDLTTHALPALHRYTRPMGHPRLVAAAAARWGVPGDRILVSAGATGGLSAAAGALLAPGDEVLVLAPYWPLIPGVVATRGGVPVEVPFYDRPGSVAARLAPHVSSRTVALYLNTPANPSGHVLSRETLAEIADFARAHELWIWSDEVYEDYVYDGEHVPMRALAPERTLTALSFSKAWGMAGNRCGLLLLPDAPGVVSAVRKVSLHATYAAGTASQLAAAVALESDGAWLRAARAAYRDAGRAAAASLGLPPPAGGTFLLVDVSAALERRDAEGLHRFLVRCVERNLVLAPGSACGAAYGQHVRLCFTAAPPDVVARGVAVLADLLGRPAP